MSQKRLAYPDTAPFLHVCCVLPHKIPDIEKLPIGYNLERIPFHGCKYGRHSEMDAILKLKNNTKSRLIPIDVFILRTSRTGKYGNSRPCQKCCKYLKIVAEKKGYGVKDVYYSFSDGIIVHSKFSQVWERGNSYVSSFFRCK